MTCWMRDENKPKKCQDTNADGIQVKKKVAATGYDDRWLYDTTVNFCTYIYFKPWHRYPWVTENELSFMVNKVA